MPVIKVKDIAWGRLRSPDLDQQEAFLLDFGMVRAARTRTALYMRGTDPNHYLHVTELGEPKFLGFAYYAASEEDLDKLSRIEGASKVEAIDEPGGGRRVRLKDPHGYQIEVVWGQERVDPLPVAVNLPNTGTDKLRRKSEPCRVKRGPSQVKRIGHGVLMSTDVVKAVRWYREVLGMIGTDDIYKEHEGNIVGSFNRCDQGEAFVDHHVLFCTLGSRNGLNHLAFEVQDIDDVMVGHDHLRDQRRYEHYWGVGRHYRGSQVFDYWADPWDRLHEHWTDSDMFNRADGSKLFSWEAGIGSQWGEAPPEKFFRHATP